MVLGIGIGRARRAREVRGRRRSAPRQATAGGEIGAASRSGGAPRAHGRHAVALEMAAATRGARERCLWPPSRRDLERILFRHGSATAASHPRRRRLASCCRRWVGGGAQRPSDGTPPAKPDALTQTRNSEAARPRPWMRCGHVYVHPRPDYSPRHVYAMSLLCTIVANASPSSTMTFLVTSAPDAPGMSRSPQPSSTTSTS